ncbi:MAG: PH domain-containing protein [Patescibacteria group bacterium]|nr:PH domain-containing protein [Patescibacteria group bacterium]
MVSSDSVEKQLKKLKFNMHSWGRTEAKELPNILLADEIIYEVVNGMYDGGFALLVATDVRVLLVDKKPLNYLTVEDFRFDMINEIDYNHRLIGAHISLSAGGKTLKFMSYNQQRLRKLITHVQHCIAHGKKQEGKQQEDQKQHLEQINQQLQAYLLAQHQQQQQFQQQMTQTVAAVEGKTTDKPPAGPDPIKPSPELNDYLFAQSLLADYKAGQAKQKYEDAKSPEAIEQGSKPEQIETTAEPEQITAPVPQAALPPVAESSLGSANSQMSELYAEGMQEIYGKHAVAIKQNAEISPALVTSTDVKQPTPHQVAHLLTNPLEINALKIAYSKLPMALRNRKFGRPSFHSHSQADTQPSVPATEI